MGLAERLGNAPQRTTGTPCSVGALEAYLTGKEADGFRAMMYELGWSGRRVYDEVQAEARELRDAGDLEGANAHSSLSLQQVNRHRSRGCRCFK